LAVTDQGLDDHALLQLLYVTRAQLLQRDCTAGCISFRQKWKNGTGRRYFGHLQPLSHNQPAKLSNSVKKITK